MGLGKQLMGQSSFGASLINESSFRGASTADKGSVAGAGPGSVGWQAPEVMARRTPTDASVKSGEGSNTFDSVSDSGQFEASSSNSTSRSVDIFSLGCIFYSTLVPGSHPFGEWYEREANIMHNRPNIEILKNISVDAHDLIAAMIQRNPLLRPTAKQICEHPFFWSLERRLSFICEFSDRLEMECDGSTKQAAKLLAVEQGAVQVVGVSWDRDLDPELVSNVQKFRTYDPSSVRDLLRLVRNKTHVSLPALSACFSCQTSNAFFASILTSSRRNLRSPFCARRKG
jgi:serine/threonine-protein kinase/endoribonuclease IRE1